RKKEMRRPRACSKRGRGDVTRRDPDMGGGQLGKAVRRLWKLVGARGAPELPDAQLLRRFVLQRDEGAFEALLRRHGPMVLGVCTRLLGDGPDAQDASQ